MRVRIVALGNPDRGDDGAALAVAARLKEGVGGVQAMGGAGLTEEDGEPGQVRVILAGRPGPGLLDLLPPDEFCLLLDTTSSGAPPGTVHEISLEALTPDLLPDLRVSSHGFGPGEALALARALGRSLPEGVFLGIEGGVFDLGESFSPAVQEALPRYRQAVRRVLEEKLGSSQQILGS